jgi:hypothetical protein
MTIEAEDLADGTTKVTVTRNFDSEKLCTGFVLDGVTVEFGKNGIGESWTHVAPSAAFGKESFSPLYCYPITHWYVNPDPLKGNDANRGYHPDCPKRTLSAVAKLAASGDVIHAAKGVYREGDELVKETRTRVVLNAGVGLVSDCGAEETVIEGVLSGEPGMSGPDSVRCAVVRAGAYIKGFTIRNGSTRVGSGNIYGESGGGDGSSNTGTEQGDDQGENGDQGENSDEGQGGGRSGGGSGSGSGGSNGSNGGNGNGNSNGNGNGGGQPEKKTVKNW